VEEISEVKGTAIKLIQNKTHGENNQGGGGERKE
jgi:hypothetical protein